VQISTKKENYFKRKNLGGGGRKAIAFFGEAGYGSFCPWDAMSYSRTDSVFFPPIIDGGKARALEPARSSEENDMVFFWGLVLGSCLGGGTTIEN